MRGVLITESGTRYPLSQINLYKLSKEEPTTVVFCVHGIEPKLGSFAQPLAVRCPSEVAAKTVLREIDHAFLVGGQIVDVPEILTGLESRDGVYLSEDRRDQIEKGAL